MIDTPKCRLCGQEKDDHGTLHHAFVGPNEDPGAAIKNPDKNKKQPQQSPVSFHLLPAPDLVLRGLLHRLGIITPEQLEAVERELTLGTPQFQPPPGKTDVLSTEPPANT